MIPRLSRWLSVSLGVPVLLVAISTVGDGSAGTNLAFGAARPECSVPRLTGLTIAEARERADRADCRLRVQGARLEEPRVQTVERQSPVKGAHALRVTVWINPVCRRSAAYGPEITEPLVTPGPTELIAGFFLDGGPLTRFSTPGCRRPQPQSGAGTVEVIDPDTGALVASQTTIYGHLAEIPLPPGSYKVTGTFATAIINGKPATQTMTVQIPDGRTVRQDFDLSIP